MSVNCIESVGLTALKPEPPFKLLRGLLVRSDGGSSCRTVAPRDDPWTEGAQGSGVPERRPGARSHVCPTPSSTFNPTSCSRLSPDPTRRILLSAPGAAETLRRGPGPLALRRCVPARASDPRGPRPQTDLHPVTEDTLSLWAARETDEKVKGSTGGGARTPSRRASRLLTANRLKLTLTRGLGLTA